MVYLQDNVGYLLRNFLNEPWMLTWRGSLINPKYLFAGVSSLVNAFSTGWRIFCSMFVSYYSHYRVYHNYCQLRLIILIYCHLRLIVIYCHLSSLICVTVPGGQVSDWHEYFRVRKRAVSWGLFLIKEIASLQNFEMFCKTFQKKTIAVAWGNCFTGLFYASLLLF